MQCLDRWLPRATQLSLGVAVLYGTASMTLSMVRR